MEVWSHLLKGWHETLSQVTILQYDPCSITDSFLYQIFSYGALPLTQGQSMQTVCSKALKELIKMKDKQKPLSLR